MRSLNVAVPLILIDVEAEERTDLQRALRERDVHYVARRFDRTDPRELGVKRVNALLLDLRGIHRRRPEITDLLRIASRRSRRCGRLLVDLAQVHVQLLAHFVANAPRRFGRRNRMPLQPAAVRVLKEVDRRANGCVEVSGEKVAGRRDRSGSVVVGDGCSAARRSEGEGCEEAASIDSVAH